MTPGMILLCLALLLCVWYQALDRQEREETEAREKACRAGPPRLPKEQEDAYWNRYYEHYKLNTSAFERHLPDLLRKCPGQYVALADGRIIGHGTNSFVLNREASSAHPDTFVLIERVVPRPIGAS
ncbi:MAG: hypothetical protein KGI66_00575 [Patescibacteria group bacterium]|nr:hypothetical protein [Patescibacteria group bacterium]